MPVLPKVLDSIPSDGDCAQNGQPAPAPGRRASAYGTGNGRQVVRLVELPFREFPPGHLCAKCGQPAPAIRGRGCAHGAGNDPGALKHQVYLPTPFPVGFVIRIRPLDGDLALAAAASSYGQSERGKQERSRAGANEIHATPVDLVRAPVSLSGCAAT